jgi:serine---pyruvate transaminase
MSNESAMTKQRLMTPGPTDAPEATLLSMARQVTHHRTPEFRGLLAEAFAGLKHVFATENDVLILTSSGTGAMEAAVVNLVPRGGKAIVLESGKFAERWRKICEVFGIDVVRYEVPWGAPFDAERLAELLQANPDATAVFSTLLETSTGVGHDIEAIGKVVRPSNALLVVDGISGVGAMECQADQWGIDVLVVGSQKALMTPPGLAFVAVSPAAWRQIESIDRPAFYFDLLAYRKAMAESDTPFTPSIPLVKALVESLRAIRAVGIEQIWGQARVLSRAARAGIEAMGLRRVAERPADGMTAVFLPDGVDSKTFFERLQVRFGVKLAGGQGPLKGRIFRLAHMGMADALDLLAGLAAIELVLAEMGQDVKLGASAAAVSQVLALESGVLS